MPDEALGLGVQFKFGVSDSSSLDNHRSHLSIYLCFERSQDAGDATLEGCGSSQAEAEAGGSPLNISRVRLWSLRFAMSPNDCVRASLIGEDFFFACWTIRILQNNLDTLLGSLAVSRSIYSTHSNSCHPKPRPRSQVYL